MRVPYLWIKEYLYSLNISPEEIAEKLTLAGVEVDAVEDFNPGIKGIVAGVIEQIKPHPDKNNLSLVTVNAGEKKSRQIICGAPNVKLGQRVFVALPGSILPGGREITEVDFQGIISEGMLCSAEEMGLDLVQDEEGILNMDSYVPTGTDLVEHLGINDKIITLSLTPNRADCLGLIGVAYELAALTKDKVKIPPEQPEEDGQAVDAVARVEITDSDLCRRYTARVVRDIRITPSPLWLQIRLLKAGIRPINNIVDITNYVMWEYGQPLHAFDFPLIKDGSIIVRRAVGGESLVTIDGVERILTPDNLVIADTSGPVALAGVMGGENSEISSVTKDVLIEAAYFDPTTVRRTARGLGLISEASQRFEKGVNPEGVMAAQNRAARLMSELAGGKVMKGVIDNFPEPFFMKEIDVSPERVGSILGIKILPDDIKSILKRLGFSLQWVDDTQKKWKVTVPLRRPDVTLEVDIVEEVARLFGYENIPVILPEGRLTPSRESSEKRIISLIRETMISGGFYEAITYSFVNARSLDKLKIPEGDALRQGIELKNPLSEEQGVLRTTLLTGLLDVLKYNFDHQISTQLLFEIGSVFIADSFPVTDLPLEKPVLGLIGTGKVTEKNWNIPSVDVDFFLIKGALETLLLRITGSELTVERTELPFLHPNRAGTIKLMDKAIGFIGELHPDVCRNYGFRQKVFLAEIELDTLKERAKLFKSFRSLPRYPASLRDLAVVVPDEVNSGEVEECIRNVGGDLVESIALFDLYEGRPIPQGSRSLAYSIVYRSSEGTLTDQLVSEVHQRIEKELYARLGVSLR